jgi:hypothetical protein
MMNASTDNDDFTAELEALADAQICGTLDASGRNRLGELLRSNPRAVNHYVAFLDMHAALQWCSRPKVRGVPNSEF